MANEIGSAYSRFVVTSGELIDVSEFRGITIFASNSTAAFVVNAVAQINGAVSAQGQLMSITMPGASATSATDIQLHGVNHISVTFSGTGSSCIITGQRNFPV